MATFWLVSNMAKNRTRALSVSFIYLFIYFLFLFCVHIMCDGKELISANLKETSNEE